MTWSRFGPSLVALTTLGALLGACTEDDVPDGDDATTTTEDVSGAEVAVTAVDFGYEGMPSELPAGTRIALTNASPTEVHELVAFLLPEVETRTAAVLFQLPTAERDAALGGPPKVVTIALPGDEGQTLPSFTSRFEAPGRYAYACFIRIGADPSIYDEALLSGSDERPEDQSAGPPHFTQGMVGDVTVP